MTVQEIEAVQEKLQIKLPSALIDWYNLVGRNNYLFPQCQFLLLEQLKIRNEVLEIAIEGQGNSYWGIRLTDLVQADPPITLTYDDYIAHHEIVTTLRTFFLNVAAWDSILFQPLPNLICGTYNYETLRVVNNHFLAVGRASTHHTLELQLFCNDLGIIDVDVTHTTLCFYGFEPESIEKVKVLVNADWDN
jgi:hypothetical protein